MIDVVQIPVTTTGGDGAATGDASSVDVSGRVLAVYLDYDGNAPATTDVTLAMADGPSENILEISNNKTDGWYYPRKQVCESDGSALTYDGTYIVAEPYVVHGRLKLSVAQADALTDCVTAYVYIGR
jgi:hypothetical protein